MMMTIDEAIRHCEEVAEQNEKDCIECAKEHRQLAEWLEELKTYQEGIEYIKSRINYFSDLGMWDVVNSLELALEILGVENDNSDV